MPDAKSNDDLQLFANAVALGNQTLKLDKGSAQLCPLTKWRAVQLEGWGRHGLQAIAGEGEFDQSMCRAAVTEHKEQLIACFRDQSKYADLIADLRWIFAEHYLLKYLNYRAKDTQAILNRLYANGDFDGDDHLITHRKRRNPTWSEIIPVFLKEEQDFSRSKSFDDWYKESTTCVSQPGLPRPPAPATDIIKRVAELFQEEILCKNEGNLIDIIWDHRKRDRDENIYPEEIWKGWWSRLADCMRSDAKYLESRLGRPQDKGLKEMVSQAITDMDHKMFLVHQRKIAVPERITHALYWTVKPTEEARQMAAVHLHLEQLRDQEEFHDGQYPDFDDSYLYEDS